MGKSKKKEEKKEENKKPKSDLKPKEETKPHEEKPFDFGGLPTRDLKKNLGCG